MVAPPQFQSLTVRQAVDRYLKSVQRQVSGHSLSPATAANYERDLSEFVELVGPDQILDDVSADDIDDAVLAYGDKPDARFRPRPGLDPKRRGQGAQARFRQSVARLFSEAALEGWVQANPMLRTKVKPRTKGLTNVARRALPQSSATALLDTATLVRSNGQPLRADMHLDLRDTFLLRLLLETGPRVSEICRADRSDLERRDDGVMWLRLFGKGRKERWVPLSPDTVDAYEAYDSLGRPEARAHTRKVLDEATGEQVITEIASVDDAERALLLTWRGIRMQPRDVQNMVKRACDRLPATVRRQVTPHGLRHTAATLLLSSGAADIKTVQALLGHASIATTGVYLDTIEAELAQAIKRHPVTGRARPSTVTPETQSEK